MSEKALPSKGNGGKVKFAHSIQRLKTEACRKAVQETTAFSEIKFRKNRKTDKRKGKLK